METNTTQNLSEIMQLASVGKTQQAITSVQSLIRQQPDNVHAIYLYGVLLLQQEKWSEAISCFQKVILRFPDYIDAHLHLADAYEKRGTPDDALETLRLILGKNTGVIFLWERLIKMMLRHERVNGAIAILFRGLSLHPDNEFLSVTLAHLLRNYKLAEIQPDWKSVLVQLCNNNAIGNNDIAHAVIDAVKQMPSFVFLLQYAKENRDIVEQQSLVKDFFKDEFMLSALSRIVFRDADCEKVFVYLRRSLLNNIAEQKLLLADDEIVRNFFCALARQCYCNEYVFYVSEDEHTLIKTLREKIENELKNDSVSIVAMESEFILLALYQSFSSLRHFSKLIIIEVQKWSEVFQPIIREQVFNVVEENEFAKQSSSLTTIRGEVSLAVQQQYEENPYPRWLRITKPHPISFETKWKQFFPNKNISRFPQPVPMLVAGCGTGSDPIALSYQFSNAKILAVDLSRKSLGYAQRKAVELNAHSIEFVQADILELHSLHKEFYLIKSTGVLHHLQNPLDGWKILVGLLHRDGIMNIALYSEAARQDVREARKFLDGKNFPPTERGIQEARNAILNLPEEHPARQILLSRDFYSTSTCRDLLMHVEEHTFTIAKINETLKELHLRFLGFELNPKLRAGFTKMFPEKDAAGDLYKWKLFESKNPTAFTGMYNFWCCKK